jgi:DNA-binding transcriptional LysR family regulator
MDRFDAMAVLLTCLEEGSLSAGARRLRSPLPTVSRKVAELEAYLRTRLVVRTSRRLELTDAGRDYVAAARRIIEQVQEAEQAAAGEYREPRGELSLTLPVSFGEEFALPVVLEFLKAHPEVDMRIMFADRTVDLVEEQIHVALRIGPLEYPTLVATRVGMIRAVTCASPAFLEKFGAPQRPEDLPKFDGVTFKGFADLSWHYQREGKPIVGEPRSRFASNSTGASIKAVLQGVGITRLPLFQIAEHLRSGALVPILEEFARPPVPVSLAYAEQGMIPLKLRAFLNYMTPRLRAVLAA